MSDDNRERAGNRLTVAEQAVELILGEEGEPADSIALVLAKLDVDIDGDLVLLHLVAVEELGEKVALVLTLGEQLGGEANRVGEAGLWVTKSHQWTKRVLKSSVKTHLERDELDEGGEGVGSDQANVVVGVAHPTEHGNNEEDDIREDLDVEQLDDICGREGPVSSSSGDHDRRGLATHAR
jgi:hypothetical protein